jgi:hypothetical protein
MASPYPKELVPDMEERQGTEKERGRTGSARLSYSSKAELELPWQKESAFSKKRAQAKA